MKKFSALLMILVMVIGLITGCGVKTYIDSEQTIITSVNKEFVIAVDNDPSTGYSWEIVCDENMLSKEHYEYISDQKEPGLFGTGGTAYYRFKALKAGQTTIMFTYRELWQTDYAIQKEFIVDIK